MTTTEELQALYQMVNGSGWQGVLLPDLRSRFEQCQIAWMHTPNQTDANIHKAAGLAAAYDYLIRGIPERIQALEMRLEEENRVRSGDPEYRPPV